MVGATRGRRSLAILVARAADGTEIERAELSLERYYEQPHGMVDSDEYRASRGIAFVEGQLFDGDGRLIKEFRSRYSRQGRFEGGRVVRADGTVRED